MASRKTSHTRAAKTAATKAHPSPPSSRAKKPPGGDSPIGEMGAEDESPGDARRSKDKTGPAVKPGR